MTAYHRHLARTRRIQRIRWARSITRRLAAYWIGIAPVCECCGLRDTGVDWRDEIRGWAHEDCVVREAALEAAEEGT